jgi:hypothetical protein
VKLSGHSAFHLPIELSLNFPDARGLRLGCLVELRSHDGVDSLQLSHTRVQSTNLCLRLALHSFHLTLCKAKPVTAVRYRALKFAKLCNLGIVLTTKQKIFCFQFGAFAVDLLDAMSGLYQRRVVGLTLGDGTSRLCLGSLGLCYRNLRTYRWNAPY